MPIKKIREDIAKKCEPGGKEEVGGGTHECSRPGSVEVLLEEAKRAQHNYRSMP